MSMKRLASCLAGAAFLTAGSIAGAHHHSMGFGHGLAGPITTASATTLSRGHWSIGLRVDYTKFDSFSDDELLQLAAAGEEVHSIDDLWAPSLGVGYGATDDLTIGFHIPFVVRHGIREGHSPEGTPEVHVHGTSDGIGDLTLMAQYRFAKLEKHLVHGAFLLGVKTPTGSTDAKDREGEKFEAEFQPGSGSWDPVFGVAATKPVGPVSVDANLFYTLSTEGTQDTTLGDLLNYNLAVSWRWDPHHSHASGDTGGHASHTHHSIDLVLEANGEWREKEEAGGVKDENSGGNILFLSPGLRLNLGERWSGFVSVGIPVWDDPNGTQHKTDGRLIFGLNAGF